MQILPGFYIGFVGGCLELGLRQRSLNFARDGLIFVCGYFATITSVYALYWPFSSFSSIASKLDLK